MVCDISFAWGEKSNQTQSSPPAIAFATHTPFGIWPIKVLWRGASYLDRFFLPCPRRGLGNVHIFYQFQAIRDIIELLLSSHIAGYKGENENDKK